MAQRGRKSSASKEVAALVAPISSESRLMPPAHLNDAVREEWLRVVNDQPAGAFTPTHAPLLEMYCKHVVKARMIDNEIEAFESAWLTDDDGLRRLDKLTAIAERESRAASSLATRLRITRQAVEHPTTVGRSLKNQAKARKPWELPLEAD